MSQGYITLPDHSIVACLQGRKMRNRNIASIGGNPTVWSRILKGIKLRVKEAWVIDIHGTPVYRADHPGLQLLHSEWNTPDSMPDWVMRMVLEITNVRFERLQDITDAEAILEGIEAIPSEKGTLYRNYLGGLPFHSPRSSYASLWNSMYGKNAWDANYHIVVMEFNVVHLPPVSRGEVAICH